MNPNLKWKALFILLVVLACIYTLVGLPTFGIVMLTYFGRVRFKGRIPGGMVAVALGTLLSWIIGGLLLMLLFWVIRKLPRRCAGIARPAF